MRSNIEDMPTNDIQFKTIKPVPQLADFYKGEHVAIAREYIVIISDNKIIREEMNVKTVK